MGLVAIREPSVAAIGSIIISSYTTSTGIIKLPFKPSSSQPACNLEIPPSTGTGKFQNIFGIPAVIEIHEDAIVVTDNIVYMYGVGNSIQEAIEDYKISIKAYFEELQENEDNLSSNLEKHLYYLRNIFVRFR